MWTLWCVNKLHKQINPFPHTEQVNSLSPASACWCTVSWDDRLNPVPQREQLNGLSSGWTRWWDISSPGLLQHFLELRIQTGFLSVWLRWCFRRLANRVNPFPHSRQVNGFSPVWTRSCASRLEEWVNLIPQSEQRNGFSPVWTLWWFRSLYEWVNHFPQSEQRNSLSPVWIRWCVTRLDDWVNPFPTRDRWTVVPQCSFAHELSVQMGNWIPSHSPHVYSVSLQCECVLLLQLLLVFQQAKWSAVALSILRACVRFLPTVNAVFTHHLQILMILRFWWIGRLTDPDVMFKLPNCKSSTSNILWNWFKREKREWERTQKNTKTGCEIELNESGNSGTDTRKKWPWKLLDFRKNPTGSLMSFRGETCSPSLGLHQI